MTSYNDLIKNFENLIKAHKEAKDVAYDISILEDRIKANKNKIPESEFNYDHYLQDIEDDLKRKHGYEEKINNYNSILEAFVNNFPPFPAVKHEKNNALHEIIIERDNFSVKYKSPDQRGVLSEIEYNKITI